MKLKYIKSKTGKFFVFEIFFLALFFQISCLTFIHHNQYMAISSANKMLSLLLKEEYEEAYLDAHPEFQKNGPCELFKAAMDSSLFRFEGGVEKIEFDYFLPVQGQRAIELLYQITYNNPGKELALHIALLGDSKEGYKVCLIDFGNVIRFRTNVKVINQQKQKIDGEIIIKPDTIIITPDSLRKKLEFEEKE